MAITKVVSTIKGSSNNTSVTSDAIDTSGADLLVVVVNWYNDGSGPTDITDDYSNTWSSLTIQSSGADRTQIWYAKNASVGSGHTFSPVMTGTPFPSIAVIAFAGTDTTSPFDAENGASGSIVSSLATGTVTPSTDGQVAVSGIIPHGGIAGLALGSGFTVAESLANAGGNEPIGLGFKIISGGSGVGVDPTWSWTGGDNDAGTRIATFKAASGGTPPTESYHGSPFAKVVGTAVGNLDPTLDAGDPATGATVTTGALPGGLTINAGPSGTVGRITGTPTVPGYFDGIGVTFTNTSGDGPETSPDPIFLITNVLQWSDTGAASSAITGSNNDGGLGGLITITYGVDVRNGVDNGISTGTDFTTSGNNEAVYYDSTSATQSSIQVQVRMGAHSMDGSSIYAGPALWSSAGNYYYVDAYTGAYRIRKVVAGFVSTVATGTAVPATSDDVILQLHAGKVSLIVQNVGDIAPTTDAAFSTAVAGFTLVTNGSAPVLSRVLAMFPTATTPSNVVFRATDRAMNRAMNRGVSQ